MTIMAVVLVVIALALGAVVGWVAGSTRKSAEMQRALAAAAVATQRALAERDLARIERAKSEAAVVEARHIATDAQRTAAVAETRVIEADKLLSNHDQLRKQIEDSFAALAQKAMRNVGETMVLTNKTQIDGSLETKRAEIEALVTPLREMLDGYRGELQQSEKSRVEAYGGLQEQIRSLLIVQESAQREASRLANALQSPTVRGSWGESSLRRCIEMAGMTENCDFSTQETFFDEEGRRRRPDVIIRMPNTRVIAVDAKVPLDEYTLAANETDEARRREHLLAHAKTVRRHIDSLSKREYQASIGDTLDFVVLFIPGEHFLSAAMITDPTLYDFAADRKVYLASPTILLPLLRAVAAGWKAERTEENAKKMHDAGVELFNRFVKVMEHISNVGKSLHGTIEKYNAAIGSIDRMLWPKGEEMQRMAQSGKTMQNIDQIDVLPLESTKLRLTMQQEEPGVLIAIQK
jgi:DNA recombination protein RmuC